MEILENPKQSRDYKNNFNIMKKALFLLGAFAAMSLVGCNGKNDCACAILDSDSKIFVCSADYEENANYNINIGTTLDVIDFDGECIDVVWTDLPTNNDKEWATLNPKDYTLKCKEM